MEERAEMAQEWIPASQYNLVILFTSFKHYHFIVQRNLFIFCMHLISHFYKFMIIQDIDFELSVKAVRIVWVLGRSEHRFSHFRHETGLVVIDVLVCFEQEVIEFL